MEKESIIQIETKVWIYGYDVFDDGSIWPWMKITELTYAERKNIDEKINVEWTGTKWIRY